MVRLVADAHREALQSAIHKNESDNQRKSQTKMRRIAHPIGDNVHHVVVKIKYWK